MKKFVLGLLAAGALFAALAVPAFASNGNTGAQLFNRGAHPHVNCAAVAANANHDDVVVEGCCDGQCPG